jgi:hypothetical protein
MLTRASLSGLLACAGIQACGARESPPPRPLVVSVSPPSTEVDAGAASDPETTGIQRQVRPASDAQIKTTTAAAQTLRQAVMQWQLTTGLDTCPSPGQLVQEKFLADASDTIDIWGRPYEIECARDDVFVTSAGPDGSSGTGDDLRVGAQAGASR